MRNFGVSALSVGGAEWALFVYCPESQVTLSVDRENAAELIREQIRRAGRESVAWWALDGKAAELVAVALFTEDGHIAPLGGSHADIRLASGGASGARWPGPKGRWQLRTVEAWADDPTAAELGADVVAAGGPQLRQKGKAAEAEACALWVRHCLVPACARLGVPPSQTPGATAVRAWRERYHPRKSWQCSDFASTQDLDWHRAGYHPGRCAVMVEPRRCYHLHGHKPKRGAAGALEGVELPRGWAITLLDVRNAYPAALAQPLPDVRGLVTDELVMGLDGVTTCTVRLDGARPLLPVRRNDPEKGWVVSWPTHGLFRGTWSNHTLYALVEAGGAVIRDVHRSESYRETYRPFDKAVKAILKQATAAPPGPLRRSLKKMSRAIYGKLGQSRAFERLVHLGEMGTPEPGGPVVLQDGELESVLGWWGQWAWCRVVAPEYPAHVNPLWAGVVTARVNDQLDAALESLEAAGARPMYCDTDGIWCAHPRALDLGELVDIGPAPGQWRVDAKASWWAVWAPKRYRSSVDAKSAWSGLARSAQREAWALGGVAVDSAVSLRESLATGVSPGTKIRRWYAP